MTTVGVEEEYLLLDADSGAALPKSAQVRALARDHYGVPADEVAPEMLRAQVEVMTPVCRDLEEVDAHLTRLRRDVGAAAHGAGCGLAASGTAPFAGAWSIPVTDEAYYRALSGYTPRIVHGQLINGMHVHVAVPDRGRGVAALNRVRPWLPVLVAMGANSPLWDGRDTGFASWRTVAFARWPVSGPPPAFTDADDYRERTRTLLEAGLIRGRAQLYWQARLSDRHPTLEIRAMDVQLRVDEAVMFAGIARGLVTTALREEAETRPPPRVPHELLRAAGWHAARHGLEGELVDPLRGREVPAADAVAALLDHIAAALERHRDLARVTAAAHRLLGEGSAARRQRQALRDGGAKALVDLVTGKTS